MKREWLRGGTCRKKRKMDLTPLALNEAVEHGPPNMPGTEQVMRDSAGLGDLLNKSFNEIKC